MLDVEKRAEEICLKMINLYNNNKISNIGFLSLYAELLNEEDKSNYLEILSYLPTKFAEMGYDIVDSDVFEISKY